jgi:quinolinate synthase
VVVYANTSAAVKARADWLVTSSCALDIVRALKDQARRSCGRPTATWATTSARNRRRHGVLERRLHRARRVQGLRARSAEEGAPHAKVLVHPESPAEVIALADAVGSTSAILKAAQRWTPRSSSSPPTTA